MDRRRPWSDLPEGIVELFINKLHFPDQVRALAVCKNWRVCKDYVRCSGCLPWVISSQRPSHIDRYGDSDSDNDGGFVFVGELIDDGDFDGVFNLHGDVNGNVNNDIIAIGDDENDSDGGIEFLADGNGNGNGGFNLLGDGDGDGNDDIIAIGDEENDSDGGFELPVDGNGNGVFDLLGDEEIDSDDGFYFDGDGESDSESDVHSSVRELFDPYSRKINQVSNPIMDSNGSYLPLAAKNGWVWALFACNDSLKVFLHNPFTNEICSIYPFPKMKMDLLHAAIKGDPTSLEYEIFTLRICGDELHVDIVKHNSYTSDLIVQKLAEKYNFIYDALYINGYIYCLFRGGTLYRYGLEGGSWNLLTSGFPEPYEPHYMSGNWLLEINDNLILVRMDVEDETHTWMIFRFDWSKMSWIFEPSLKSCAIYISDFLAFSTPLKSSNGELLDDCRLFHNEDCEVKCYSMNAAGGVEIQSEEYSWIRRPLRFQLSFIERPIVGI